MNCNIQLFKTTTQRKKGNFSTNPPQSLLLQIWTTITALKCPSNIKQNYTCSSWWKSKENIANIQRVPYKRMPLLCIQNHFHWKPTSMSCSSHVMHVFSEFIRYVEWSKRFRNAIQLWVEDYGICHFLPL